MFINAVALHTVALHAVALSLRFVLGCTVGTIQLSLYSDYYTWLGGELYSNHNTINIVLLPLYNVLLGSCIVVTIQLRSYSEYYTMLRT